MKPLRLGTRGSELALAQSRWVREKLETLGVPGIEIQIFKTSGDLVQDRPLPEIGGKGLFTKELDDALLADEIDFAVHSLKDLPTEQERGLTIASVPEREDPRDVLALPIGVSGTLTTLSAGARIGTSSTRRKALLQAFRSDLEVVDIRGNIDTRLRKLDQGHYDAVILAGAGLKRLGLSARVGQWLERTSWLAAPGQGALGLVSRSDDRETVEILKRLENPEAAAAVTAEREVLRVLEGGCQAPVGAAGLAYGFGLRLWGLVLSPDGRRVVRCDRTGRVSEARELGQEVAQVLIERGAAEVLEEAR